MNTQKIAILTDSCTDVPREYIDAYGIFVVPVRVVYRDREYADRVEITPAEVYDRLSTEIPHTSLPSNESITDALSAIETAGYTRVLAVTISSALSGTGNAVRLAAQAYPGLDIRVIDTRNIGIGAGFQAIYAGKLVEQGLDVEEICRRLNESIKYTKVFFCLSTLEYLRKGGRIGHVAAAVGTILNLKPVISCDEKGAYYVAAKTRGRAKSIADAMALALKQVTGGARYCIAVASGKAQEEAQSVLAELKKRLPDCSMFLETDVSPALVVHTGPGLLGIGVHIMKD